MSSNLRPPGTPLASGEIPANVLISAGSVICGDHSFARFRGQRTPAVTIGTHCTLEDVHFAVGAAGEVRIGDFCHFSSAILLCELELVIGNYVSIGWNVTIADSDFHPLSPAERIADAIACSPLAKSARPPIKKQRVQIEDDVWIGPNAAILKGVRIGAGAVIEPGSVVTRDVPAGARVMGNPARVVVEPS